MAAPTVNITETIGLTNVTTAEATTNFAGFRHSGGGSPTPQLESDIFVQGSNAVSIKVSGATRDEGVWYTNVGAVDLTTDANKHVLVWGAATTMSQHDTIANGGFYVIVASAVGNWNKYFVNGSDTIDGRFVRYIIDVTKKPSETAATAATLTAITHIGIGVKGTISAKSENVIIDRIDYGTGLQIEDGDSITPGSWEELFAADDASANKYGIIEKRSGVYFMKGGLQIGDSSGTKTSLWDDFSNSTVVFEDPQYHNGDALVSAITSEDLYKIACEGNATGTTDIRWGDVVGGGAARQGTNGGSIQSAGPKWELDASTNILDLDGVELYGVKLQGAGLTRFSTSAKTTLAGCNFVNCDEIQVSDAEWLNNTVSSPIPNRGLRMLTTHNVKQTRFVFSNSNIRPRMDRVWQVDVSPTPDVFVDETDDFNSSATADIQFFNGTGGSGDYCAFGSVQQYGRLRLSISTAGDTGTIVWEYWNGSSWSALENLVDATNGLTNSGNNQNIDFRPPNDWNSLSLNGESPLYYLRVRMTGGSWLTAPIGSVGTARRVIEHMVRHADVGSYTYDDLTFFGVGQFKFDVENSNGATSVDLYALANHDTDQIIGNGTINGVGQSFTAIAGTLTSLRVVMSALGSPTGTVVAKLYAHSGTFGTSSVPTGAALATSNTINAAGFIVGEDLEYDFEFEDEFLLVVATNYVWTIEYTAGDASNHVIVRYDTGGSHGGNKSTLNGSWAADASDDCVFQMGHGAIVTISATNDADPATDDQTGNIAGATIINNAVTLTVNVEDEDGVALSNVRVAIYTDDIAMTELMNEDTVSGTATESFNFSGNQDVTVRVRESPNTASGRFIPFFTRGTITVDGFSLDVILQDDTIATVN